MKLTVFTCDHCEKQVHSGGIIESVEITFGGNGAARDKIDGIDLCRECFGNVVSAIRARTTSRVTSDHRGS